MPLQVNDLLCALDERRITTGDCCGAYRTGDERIIWYFASIGLLPFVKERTSEVLVFLNRYLQKLNADGNIFDHSGDCVLPAKPTRDSDDAYAGTFLSLVAAYLKQTGDKTWFDAQRPTLLRIAEKNILSATYPNHLTHVYQLAADYDMAYLQDNCEVYRGLMDFSQTLSDFKQKTDAKRLSAAAARMVLPMESFYDATAKGWRNDYSPGGGYGAIEPRFYPGGTTQVFPQAFGVPLGTAKYTAGYTYLNAHYSGWATSDPDGSAGGYPHVMLAYVALLRGDKTRVQQMLDRVERILNTPALRGLVSTNELGWAKRILDRGGYQ